MIRLNEEYEGYFKDNDVNVVPPLPPAKEPEAAGEMQEMSLQDILTPAQLKFLLGVLKRMEKEGKDPDDALRFMKYYFSQIKDQLLEKGVDAGDLAYVCYAMLTGNH